MCVRACACDYLCMSAYVYACVPEIEHDGAPERTRPCEPVVNNCILFRGAGGIAFLRKNFEQTGMYVVLFKRVTLHSFCNICRYCVLSIAFR